MTLKMCNSVLIFMIRNMSEYSILDLKKSEFLVTETRIRPEISLLEDQIFQKLHWLPWYWLVWYSRTCWSMSNISNQRLKITSEKNLDLFVCLVSQIKACCSIGWYFNPEHAKVLTGMLVHCMCSSMCWYVSPEHADVCLVSQTRAFQSFVIWIHSVVIVCLVSQIRACCSIG